MRATLQAVSLAVSPTRLALGPRLVRPQTADPASRPPGCPPAGPRCRSRRRGRHPAPGPDALDRPFLAGPLAQMPDLAVRTADPVGYVNALDRMCRATGEHLAAHFGLDRVTP